MLRLPPMKLPLMKLPPMKLPPIKLPPTKLPPTKLPPTKILWQGRDVGILHPCQRSCVYSISVLLGQHQ